MNVLRASVCVCVRERVLCVSVYWRQGHDDHPNCQSPSFESECRLRRELNRYLSLCHPFACESDACSLLRLAEAHCSYLQLSHTAHSLGTYRASMDSTVRAFLGAAQRLGVQCSVPSDLVIAISVRTAIQAEVTLVCALMTNQTVNHHLSSLSVACDVN